MELHNCPACGLAHAAPGEVPESDEVKIARLNKERDVEIARLQARQDKDWNDTRVEVAEIEAGAEVASAEATAEIVGAVLADDEPAEPEPVPIIVDPPEPPADEPEPDVPPPPPADELPEPPARPKGMWGGYR